MGGRSVTRGTTQIESPTLHRHKKADTNAAGRKAGDFPVFRPAGKRNAQPAAVRLQKVKECYEVAAVPTSWYEVVGFTVVGMNTNTPTRTLAPQLPVMITVTPTRV